MAMVRFVRLRSVQRWPEDWMRDVKVIYGQAISFDQFADKTDRSSSGR